MTRLPLLTLFLAGLPSLAWGQDLDNLLRRLPDSTNAIAIVNVEAAYKSPMAQKENWIKKQEEASLAGTASFPPSVKLAVLATQFAPGSPSRWTAGLAVVKTNVTVEDLVKREGGREATVGSTKVAESPRNAFFFPLEPRLVGMMHPANRQETSRWLRYAKEPRAQLSDYLLQAAARAKRDAALVMAVDLTDLADANAIRLRLSDAHALMGKNVDVDAFAKFLSNVRGLTFTVTIDDQAKGELQLDFKDEVRPYNTVLKPLLLEVLSEMGIAIEGMKDWAITSTDPTGFKLSYRLHDAELRQIVSLITLPTPSLASPGETPDAKPYEPPTPLEASKKYYREVTRLIEDLKVLRDKATSHNQNATWHDQYAKKVDQLPILNVDPDLLSWGSSVANRFRALAASLRGVQLQASTLDQYKQAYYWEQAPSWGGGGYYGYGGWYGGAYYNPGSTWSVNNYQAVRAAKVEAVTKGIAERNEVWNTIDADTAEIRRKMVAKYQVDFSSQATFQRGGQPDK